MPLPNFVKLLNWSSYSEVLNFFSYFRSETKKFVIDLKLQDSHFWLDELREPGISVDNLRKWIRILDVEYDILHTAFRQMWWHLRACQLDLAHIIENTLQK